jgi:multiple sugar transport system substrate-binding protein
MYNGLADAIWVGSKHKPQARRWVAFMASEACQRLVADGAVVFPAIPAATRRAVAAQKEKGVDVSAFTSYLKTKKTILYPITDKAPQINLIVQPTLEKVLLGDEDAGKAIRSMNDQVNNLLRYAR